MQNECKRNTYLVYLNAAGGSAPPFIMFPTTCRILPAILNHNATIWAFKWAIKQLFTNNLLFLPLYCWYADAVCPNYCISVWYIPCCVCFCQLVHIIYMYLDYAIYLMLLLCTLSFCKLGSISSQVYILSLLLVWRKVCPTVHNNFKRKLHIPVVSQCHEAHSSKKQLKLLSCC